MVRSQSGSLNTLHPNRLVYWQFSSVCWFVDACPRTGPFAKELPADCHSVWLWDMQVICMLHMIGFSSDLSPSSPNTWLCDVHVTIWVAKHGVALISSVTLSISWHILSDVSVIVRRRNHSKRKCLFPRRTALMQKPSHPVRNTRNHWWRVNVTVATDCKFIEDGEYHIVATCRVERVTVLSSCILSSGLSLQAYEHRDR